MLASRLLHHLPGMSSMTLRPSPQLSPFGWEASPLDDPGDTIMGTKGPDTLVGTSGDDVIFGLNNADDLDGGDGDDTLDGGRGPDHIDGGAGLDVASYASAGGPVYASIANQVASAAEGVDRLDNIEGLIGSQFDDGLISGIGDSSLWGGQGDDSLANYAGDDLLDGGDGTDAVAYQFLDSGVTVNLGISGPQHTRGGGIDTLISIEIIYGSNYGDSLSTGNVSATLLGGDGNDSLVGGSGDSVLEGEQGEDVVSFEAATRGLKINLGSDSAQKDGVGGTVTLIGVESAIGTDFDDLLKAGGQGFMLDGGRGDDRLTGDGGGNLLLGGAGNDVLSGGASFDTLVGGRGADTLTAGPGQDTFQFNALNESTKGATDLITDLHKEDVIDISAIDADSTQDGDQAFTLVDRLDGHAGEAALSYSAKTDMTQLRLDVDGDGHADMVVMISGDHADFTAFGL